MSDVATNEKMLAKVQALLAKAESTPFPEEAAAFVAKAQELMTRHAIDEVMANARSHSGARPILRPIVIGDPYRSAKCSLLASVALANDVRVVRGHQGAITLVGFEGDVGRTEVLFASLLVQATREMHVAGARITDGRLRAFRHAFFVSFGTRIGARLREARAEATAAAESEHGTSLVPLMDARGEAVEDFLKEAFPALQSRRPTLSHRGGWLSGRVAADRADLGTGRLNEG